MVKVFLCESATACLEQLKSLFSSLSKVCILVPNSIFQRNCFEIWPSFKFIFTPSQWMELLELRPLKFEECIFLKNYKPFDDPASAAINLLQLYPESFQQSWLDWMKKNTIHSFSELMHTCSKNFPFESVILYGHFKANIRTILLKNLQNLNINAYQILHTTKDKSIDEGNDLIEKSKQFESVSIKTIAIERFFIQKFLEENDDTVCVQLPGYSCESLFSKTIDRSLSTWLDWQEQGDFKHFLIHLKCLLKHNPEDFKRINLQLEQAFSMCLTDRFSHLQAYCLEHEDCELENFKQGDWPEESSFADFVHRLQKTLPNYFQIVFLTFPNFSFSVTKECFFSYLRRLLRYPYVDRKKFKYFEEVLYFPCNNYLIPHCLRSHEKIINHSIRSFIATTLAEGKNITVCAPQIGNNKEECQPLFGGKKFFEFPFKNQGKLKVRTCLSLSPRLLQRLSCKNWERFYLCPLQTWLENILKTQKIPLVSLRIKNKIIGEWVHQNLQFEAPPTSLNDWLQHIQTIATMRWLQLQKFFQKRGQTISYIFKMWHQKSLLWSQQMAIACRDLLSWELYSEWVLPSNAPIKGRIDLLAVQENRAVIVDFKTSLHYLFTPKQINKGHGLQLWLYGTYLQSMGKSVQLRIIDRLGKSTQLDFEQVKPEVADIESWLASTQNFGDYIYLPDEKKELLPLCL